MKPVCYLLVLSLFLLSCKKGKTLENQVVIQLITKDTSGIYPEGYFSIYTDNYPFPATLTPIYPSYVHDMPPDEIAFRFNSKLSSFLNKNNIILQEDTADYVLEIQSMKLEESLKSKSYIDSCSSGYPTREVYYSTLKFKVKATLYKNGIEIDSWSKEGNSREGVRAKTDKCNEPKIFPIIRGSAWLVDQVAKELRVRVSRKLYVLEQ